MAATAMVKVNNAPKLYTKVKNTLYWIEVGEPIIDIPVHPPVIFATLGGIDYVAKQTTGLSFNLGSNSMMVCECIQLLPDNIVEGDEEFEVVVSSSNSAVLGSRATVRIKDDDGMELT